METMTLWTRQVPQVWESLQKTGIYRCREEYIREKNDTIADYYLKLYQWFTREAKKYAPVPQGAEYPIWLCLDEEMMLQPAENTVILKLEVPADQVLLCNYDAWGYRVNYWYVPVNKADEERHRSELSRYGIHSDDELINTHKGSFYPHLQQKIRRSWSRVFTQMDVDRSMQVATLWELRREWVQEVRIYGTLDSTDG